jgi:hypothetical protein
LIDFDGRGVLAPCGSDFFGISYAANSKMQTNLKPLSTRALLFLVFFLVFAWLTTVHPAAAQLAADQLLSAQTIVAGLDNPTDFSVTADGEIAFVAEQGAGQIRRVQGDADEIVVGGIETAEQTASSIAVHAINANRILVGVSGFSSTKRSLGLFEVASENLPLDFHDQHVKHSRPFERVLERTQVLDVLQFFDEQRGLSMVCELGGSSPRLCEIYFKDGNLKKVTPLEFESNNVNLSTLAVDQIGGYLAALTKTEPTQVVFYRAKKTLPQSFPIDLQNIVALRFSPIHNRLFAAVRNTGDNLSAESGGDGIYEILADGNACKSRLVIAIERPMKLKFDGRGNAWVLCQPDAGSGLGVLKKVNGVDVSPTMEAVAQEAASGN